MKLTAKGIPYSSTVGGSFGLVAADGHTKYIVSIMGTTAGINKKQSDQIAQQIVELINTHQDGEGIEVDD